MQVKVFSAGMPPDSMWVEPASTWEDILAGTMSPAGRYISVETALRLIAEAVDAWWAKARSQGGTLTQCGPDYGDVPERWNGSEGGTPRVIDDGKTSSWSVGESRAALAERIAIENAEYRKLVFADETAAWPPGNYPYDEAPPIESAAERIASEIGDDRRVDEEADRQLAEELSEFDRRDRIASEIGDRKIDQQRDNEQL